MNCMPYHTFATTIRMCVCVWLLNFVQLHRQWRCINATQMKRQCVTNLINICCWIFYTTIKSFARNVPYNFRVGVLFSLCLSLRFAKLDVRNNFSLFVLFFRRIRKSFVGAFNCIDCGLESGQWLHEMKDEMRLDTHNFWIFLLYLCEWYAFRRWIKYAVCRI